MWHVTAGGVGLIIQAASVVVLCEPQLDPVIGWQAIARARPMGQLETMQVHRWLTELGVDQHLTEMRGLQDLAPFWLSLLREEECGVPSRT